MTRLLGLLLLVPGLALAQATPPAAPPAEAAPTDVGPAPGAAEQEAGDVAEIDKDATGPLRERIRPVSGKLFTKAGRFELSPSASVSFRDAFFTKYVFGGALAFHLSDAFAVSLRGGYALNTVSGAGQKCVVDPAEGPVGCRAPTFAELDGLGEGQILLLGGADLQWAPIYGKLGLLAESFAHFDLYAIGGVSVVQYAAPRPGTTLTGSQPALSYGGNVGVGSRFFLNRWLTLRAELRDLIYPEVTRRRGPTAPVLRNQFLFELGVSVFLPSFVEER
jgi:outer membrane beta-barrel protein